MVLIQSAAASQAVLHNQHLEQSTEISILVWKNDSQSQRHAYGIFRFFSSLTSAVFHLAQNPTKWIL